MTCSEHAGWAARRPVLREICLLSAIGVWAALLGAFVTPSTASAQTCTGYTVCPTIYLNRDNFPQAKQADAVIAQAETSLVGTLKKTTTEPLKRELLGGAILFDKTLSVNGNVACDSCHSRTSGFTGPISAFNVGPAAYNGSSGVRSGPRTILSYAYAPLAPTLHFDAATNNFVGGLFYDMRATGLVTGSAAADQALGPFLSPEEYGMPDPACVVFRMSQGVYAKSFEQVWGTSSFAIKFPLNTATLCSIPSTSNDPNPQVVPLVDADRVQAQTTFQNIGLSIAAFETTTLVSPFTSKFDFVRQGLSAFNAQEELGFQAFMGRTSSHAPCRGCHVASGSPALFTNFAAFNIGVPANPNMPFFNESVPDTFGYVANPAGTAFVDLGLGNFLRNSGNPTWAAMASQFDGTFEVPSLRNSARKPGALFVKSYTHTGFFQSLPELVHFYYTRQLLNTCGGSTVTVGVDCWPAPAVTANLDNRIGLLGTGFATEEAAIVAFLATLSDNAFPPL